MQKKGHSTSGMLGPQRLGPPALGIELLFVKSVFCVPAELQTAELTVMSPVLST